MHEFRSFEETVSQLVDESEHLSTAKDFMDKCDALSGFTHHYSLPYLIATISNTLLPVLAQVEISEMEMQKVREIEEFQQRMVQLTNDSNTDFLGLNNFLVDLDKAYEKAHAQGIAWEQVLVKSRDVIVGEESKCTRIIDSTRQLYLLLCKRNGREPNLQDVTVEDQLDYIRDETEILVQVLKSATEFMSANEESVQGEKGTQVK